MFCGLLSRVKLAVHKETRECVAVKMVHMGNGLTQDTLKKEVRTGYSGNVIILPLDEKRERTPPPPHFPTHTVHVVM